MKTRAGRNPAAAPPQGPQAADRQRGEEVGGVGTRAASLFRAPAGSEKSRYLGCRGGARRFSTPHYLVFALPADTPGAALWRHGQPQGGNAVARNRVKRWLREHCAAGRTSCPPTSTSSSWRAQVPDRARFRADLDRAC